MQNAWAGSVAPACASCHACGDACVPVFGHMCRAYPGNLACRAAHEAAPNGLPRSSLCARVGSLTPSPPLPSPPPAPPPSQPSHHTCKPPPPPPSSSLVHVHVHPSVPSLLRAPCPLAEQGAAPARDAAAPRAGLLDSRAQRAAPQAAALCLRVSRPAGRAGRVRAPSWDLVVVVGFSLAEGESCRKWGCPAPCHHLQQ